jgi:hypothetical protein
MTEGSLSAVPQEEVDTSSFVDHLRLVHFTLIAACLITIIAITSQESSSAGRAYDQTNELLRMNDVWHNGQWIENFVARERANVIQNNVGINQQEIALEIVDPPKSGNRRGFLSSDRLVVNLRDSWRLAEVGPIGTAVSIGRDFHIADNDDNAKRDDPPNFSNLDGAIKIWDRLNRFRY